MKRNQNKASQLICPRCRSEVIEIVANSPIKGEWEIYKCNLCLYAWRSTEPEDNTNANKFPKAFRLQKEEITNFPIVPDIPPLRSEKEKE